MKWPHPFWVAAAAGLLVLAAAFVPVLWKGPSGASATEGGDAPRSPWQIRREPDGSVRALGLRLPGSTLGEVAQQWGDGLEVAVLGQGAEGMALEGYVERWESDGVTGKLVIVAAAPEASLRTWQSRGTLRSGEKGPAPRWHLAAADRAAAGQAPVIGLTFLPSTSLDAQVLAQRYGTPSERRGDADGREHWLYPERGLAILLDPRGPEVIQVVAPAEFERRLRAPLGR